MPSNSHSLFEKSEAKTLKNAQAHLCISYNYPKIARFSRFLLKFSPSGDGSSFFKKLAGIHRRSRRCEASGHPAMKRSFQRAEPTVLIFHALVLPIARQVLSLLADNGQCTARTVFLLYPKFLLHVLLLHCSKPLRQKIRHGVRLLTIGRLLGLSPGIC